MDFDEVLRRVDPARRGGVPDTACAVSTGLL